MATRPTEGDEINMALMVDGSHEGSRSTGVTTGDVSRPHQDHQDDKNKAIDVALEEDDLSKATKEDVSLVSHHDNGTGVSEINMSAVLQDDGARARAGIMVLHRHQLVLDMMKQHVLS